MSSTRVDIKSAVPCLMYAIFFFLADSISLSGVSTGTELGVRFSGDGSLANVGITQSSISEYSPELNSHLEGCLATEASMVVLDTLELIVQV